MFETAEIGHKVDKDQYDTEVPVLREKLLAAQNALLEAKRFPVIVLIGGVDGAGKGETVNLLNSWMDPRHIATHAFGAPSDEERERPPMWRFWRALPPKGQIGILFGSWYTQPILDRVFERTSDDELRHAISSIRRFERMLAQEGTVIVKLWFHLSKPMQKRRLHMLESDKRTRWRVTPQDWEHFKLYDRFREICEIALRDTSTGEAPWHVIEGSDENYRSLAAGQILLENLEKGLAAPPPLPIKRAPAALTPQIDKRTILNTLDYSQKLDSKDYKAKLETLQGRLNLTMRRKKFRTRSMILVFEGPDAAGKGSTIRRITGALDARFYHVVPIAAPTDEELAQPYLWRFWRNIPRLGRVTIFDRSWYGRVLVERVEGLIAESDWLRAYDEITDFEEELSDRGAIVLKFWLAITKAEQLARFKAREETAFKTFKITPDDWRNRQKWAAYERAACDMIERTSSSYAPWHVIPANDKQFARIKVLEAINDALKAKL